MLQLEAYVRNYPGVRLLDPPAAILRLGNRVTMLESLVGAPASPPLGEGGQGRGWAGSGGVWRQHRPAGHRRWGQAANAFRPNRPAIVRRRRLGIDAPSAPGVG